jgi:hypothetical protein
MRLLFCLFVYLVALALHAQDPFQPAGEGAQNRQLTLEELKKFYADETNRITTGWIDMATSKEVWASFTKAGYLPVFAEGKWEHGIELHRIGYKSLLDAHPGAGRMTWYCYYGMEQDSFDQRNRDYLKMNYTLVQKMSFSDQTGKLYYCAVWVNPTPGRQ